MLRAKMMKIAASAAVSAVIVCTGAFAADVVSVTDVNVRSGPDNSCAVVAVMKKGTSAEKLGKSGNWIKVRVNGKTGYVYSKYLKDAPGSPDEADVEKKTVSVTASSLRVRSGPGTTYNTIGYMKKGSEAVVVKTSGIWYKIEYKGKYGYISSQYTKDVTKTVEITASSLHVRSGPGKEYKSIGTLRKGKTATVIAETADWYRIEYKDSYGYISKKYAREVTSEKPSAGKTVTITTDLYVRSGPGKEYKAIGILKKGKTVEVFEKKNGWYRIKYNGNTGYISAKYTK
ncbi:SH3 domain-containing protein [Butyricicoccus sp.]|uniref:SH3 domain-containing protein n=1 Tax=Butyricicoccus sp. TaxID=2049021 RepID=UPI003F173EA2